MNEFRFICRVCGQLSDDGRTQDQICMSCADDLDNPLFITNRWLEKWELEPDFISLEKEDYHVLIRRIPHTGSLCGYVGVLDKEIIGDVYDIVCHGGVTYIGNELDGMLEGRWYIGFDTAHHGDYVPKIVESLKEVGIDTSHYNKATYRDVPFVINECSLIIEQLEKMKSEREGK